MPFYGICGLPFECAVVGLEGVALFSCVKGDALFGGLQFLWDFGKLTGSLS